MLYVYLACLIIGGILLVASLLAGAIQSDADADVDADIDADVDADVDADIDADVDADVDADIDHDVDADHAADHSHDVDAAGFWLPFLSVRFWVFGLSFFGLCGTLLTVIDHGPIVTPIVSVLVGLFCGTVAAYVVPSTGVELIFTNGPEFLPILGA